MVASEALFTEMVRTAESLLHRQSAETSDGQVRLASTSSPLYRVLPLVLPVSRMIRRQQWLSAVAPEDASASQEAPPVPAQAPSRDKYGVDLNEFKMLSGKKPRDWKKAVRIAEWIHIDEMRSLLELWSVGC